MASEKDKITEMTLNAFFKQQPDLYKEMLKHREILKSQSWMQYIADLFNGYMNNEYELRRTERLYSELEEERDDLDESKGELEQRLRKLNQNKHINGIAYVIANSIRISGNLNISVGVALEGIGKISLGSSIDFIDHEDLEDLKEHLSKGSDIDKYITE